MVHDAKRNRLLFFRKGYGDKSKYSGELHTFDLETGKVSKLTPKGMAGAAAIPYLCQIRYDVRTICCWSAPTLPPIGTPADCGEPRRMIARAIAGCR